MTLGPAHALAALLLEHADLRAARLAVDDADDPGVGDKRRAREHVAAVFLDEQHLLERDLGAGSPRTVHAAPSAPGVTLT